LQSFKGKVCGFLVKTIDTTGAGDAFVGALLVSMAKDTAIFHVFILFSFGSLHFIVSFLLFFLIS
jgi:sugar/nucleoside kinase (ribokinase family)